MYRKHIARFGITFLFIAVAFALFMSAYSVAAAAGAGQSTPTGQIDLSGVLGPFVLLATTIERIWEAIFDTIEKGALAGGKLLGVSADSMAWMHVELANAQGAMNDLVKKLNTPLWTPALEAQMANAETRLRDAQLRLQDALKDPRYTSTKRVVSIVGSLIMGLVISIAGNSAGPTTSLTFFHNANIALPNWLDVVLTGLVIGAGPGPVHSLIGALQAFRDTVTSVGNLAQGAAIKNAVLAQPPSATITSDIPQLAAPRDMGQAKDLVAPVETVTTVQPLPPSPAQQRRLQNSVRSR